MAKEQRVSLNVKEVAYKALKDFFKDSIVWTNKNQLNIIANQQVKKTHKHYKVSPKVVDNALRDMLVSENSRLQVRLGDKGIREFKNA